jgi:hypothetical protein
MCAHNNFDSNCNLLFVAYHQVAGGEDNEYVKETEMDKKEQSSSFVPVMGLTNLQHKNSLLRMLKLCLVGSIMMNEISRSHGITVLTSMRRDHFREVGLGVRIIQVTRSSGKNFLPAFLLL